MSALLALPHGMRSRVCVTVPHSSVSVRRSHPAVCCCGPGGQEISIDCCTAGCEQCLVVSRRRKLNTDLFGSAMQISVQ